MLPNVEKTENYIVVAIHQSFTNSLASRNPYLLIFIIEDMDDL